MPVRMTNDTGSRCALGVLAAFALAVGLCDCLSVVLLRDTFLPPSTEIGRAWSELGDWSAVQCYAGDWRVALLRWAGSRLPDGAVVTLGVLVIHALLWGGVYCVGRALFGGSPWVAVLAVVLVRIAPDLFQVHLLSAQDPSRMTAVALAFWSLGLTIHQRWVAACCLAGLAGHFSPIVACWLAQFVVVAMFSLNRQWGWRRSLVGMACFLAIAGGPLVRFLVGEIAPAVRLPSNAMLGLHLFTDPSLSPFSVPLWSNVCLVVYLAMAFVWMKRHFNRRTTPVALIFFLIGLAGLLLEIIFVGLVPIERAARFELQTMRGFWLFWIAILYAPELADEIRASWQKGKAWRAIFRGLTFSLPVVWSALTLIERLRRPPRWSRVLVVLMLVLLALAAFVFPHGERPVGEPILAVAIAVAVVVVAGATALVGRERTAFGLARSVTGATVAFALVLAILDGGTVARAFSETRRVVARCRAWSEACRWVAEHSPADSKWSIPWRPRQFRRWTGRAVLVNRDEVPRDPRRRLGWFEKYAETHGWAGGLDVRHLPSPVRESLAQRLNAYRRSFLLGVARRPAMSPDWLVISPVLVQTYGVRYAVCDRDRPPRRQEGWTSSTERLQHLHTEGPFEIYRIDSASPEGP